MPLGQLAPDQIPTDRITVTICRSGKRSSAAATQLAAAGIDVRNLDGGMTAWAAAGHPIRRDDGADGTVA
jgi:rhodanese-related sulfurtransferase